MSSLRDMTSIRRLRGGLRNRLDGVAPLVAPALRRGQGDAVHFTFDDGPADGYTDAIASALESHGYTATFFFTGTSAKARPDLVRRIAAAGHAVGSHSATHQQSWVTPVLSTFRDYWSGHRQVEKALGARTRLFRPPYGTHDLAASLFARVRRCHLVLWSCDGEDWLENANPADIVGSIAPHIGPGAIVLLHDHICDNPAARDRSPSVLAVEALADLTKSLHLRAERISVA